MQRIELTQDSSRQERVNKDLLVIGSLDRQPLFRRWASHMLLQPNGQRRPSPPRSMPAYGRNSGRWMRRGNRIILFGV